MTCTVQSETLSCRLKSFSELKSLALSIYHQSNNVMWFFMLTMNWNTKDFASDCPNAICRQRHREWLGPVCKILSLHKCKSTVRSTECAAYHAAKHISIIKKNNYRCSNVTVDIHFALCKIPCTSSNMIVVNKVAAFVIVQFAWWIFVRYCTHDIPKMYCVNSDILPVACVMI